MKTFPPYGNYVDFPRQVAIGNIIAPKLDINDGNTGEFFAYTQGRTSDGCRVSLDESYLKPIADSSDPDFPNTFAAILKRSSWADWKKRCRSNG